MFNFTTTQQHQPQAGHPTQPRFAIVENEGQHRL